MPDIGRIGRCVFGKAAVDGISGIDLPRRSFAGLTAVAVAHHMHMAWVLPPRQFPELAQSAAVEEAEVQEQALA